MSDIEDAQQTVREAMARPGDWLTGKQRRAVWREVRASSSNELDQQRRQALSPNAVNGAHAATAELSASAMEVVHRTASDPGRLTRAWADEHRSELGEETYTELVGVTAIVSVLDRFDRAMGRPNPPPANRRVFGPTTSAISVHGSARPPAQQRPTSAGRSASFR
jgi:hypothetical protein